MAKIEIVQAPLSIQELMDRAVQKFRNRTLDKTGHRAYLVHAATWDTVTTAGLSSSDMLSFVLGKTIVSKDVINQIRRRLPIHSDAEHRDFVFAGNILIEELKLSRPELVQEEDDRLHRLGFMPKK